jgi:hypothetical protein
MPQQPVAVEAIDMSLVDEYRRAADHLSAEQIYLLGNPLLTEPFAVRHSEPRLLGHWGATPGLVAAPRKARDRTSNRRRAGRLWWAWTEHAPARQRFRSRSRRPRSATSRWWRCTPGWTWRSKAPGDTPGRSGLRVGRGRGTHAAARTACRVHESVSRGVERKVLADGSRCADRYRNTAGHRCGCSLAPEI